MVYTTRVPAIIAKGVHPSGTRQRRLGVAVYGLVNKAIQDFAVTAGGEDAWERIRERAEVEALAFVSMQSYPDELTYRLVGAAAEVFDRPADELLRDFGRHWILYTGREGYGPLLQNAGATLREFLHNLDALHARVALSMPDLHPPSFICEDAGEGRMTVRYFSERTGLAPMVVGLLEGLGALFGQDVRVTHVAARGASHDPEEFLVSYAPIPAEMRHLSEDGRE